MIFEHEAHYISSRTVNNRTIEKNEEAIAAFSVTLSVVSKDKWVTEEKVVIKTKSGSNYLIEPDNISEYFAVWSYSGM